jgi:hypothetical protein
VRLLARTFIQSAQGTIKSQNFNSDDGVFKATFLFDATIDAPTVLHVLSEAADGEPVWYPEGPKLTLT